MGMAFVTKASRIVPKRARWVANGANLMVPRQDEQVDRARPEFRGGG
jgi:hypothetical protein